MADNNPFGLHGDERTYFFIEGANLYATCKNHQINIDYKRLLNHFAQNAKLVRASYYTALKENEEFQSIKPLLDFLDFNGYNVVTKTAKEYVNNMGQRRVKGSVDIEMCCDMITSVEHSAGRAEHVVLFSGDGDFTYVVKELQRRGARVTVASTVGMAADELRRQADAFIDISTDPVLDVIEKIEATAERPAATVVLPPRRTAAPATAGR